MTLPPRVLGALLLAAAFTYMLLTANMKGPWLLFGFLALFVPGALLMGGIIGRSAPAQAARARPAEPVTEARRFRYPPLKPAARMVLRGLGLLILGQAVFAGVLLRAQPHAAAWVALPLLAIASSIPVYLRRHAAQAIDIERNGLRARTYTGTRAVRWDEITALDHFEIRLLGTGSAGDVYDVYTGKGRIRFSGGLDGAPELAEIIARATGLDWSP